MNRNRIIKITGFWIVCFLLVLGCSTQKEITGEQFQKKLEAKDFSVQDVTEGLDAETISQSLIALHANYQIEYFDLKSKEGATSHYELQKNKLSSLKIKGSKETEKKTSHSMKYTLETKKTYSVVSKIEKTLIYTSVDKKYQNEVEDIMESLGY